MPSANGFVQSYNAQAAVTVDRACGWSPHSQPANQRPAASRADAERPQDTLGKPDTLLADHGLSKANSQAGVD
jgi:hypothetical protein